MGRPTPPDAGFTLVELAVAMACVGLLVVVGVQAQVAVLRSTSRTFASADRVTAARLSIDTLERQARSAGALASDAALPGCAAVGTGTTCVRLSSRYQNRARCSQWQVLPDAAAPGTAYLRTRGYSPTWTTDGDVDAWRTLARGLQLPTAGSPPFTLAATGLPPTVKSLDVAVSVLDPSNQVGPSTISASFAPRGLVYSGPSSTCSATAP